MLIGECTLLKLCNSIKAWSVPVERYGILPQLSQAIAPPTKLLHQLLADALARRRLTASAISGTSSLLHLCWVA